MPRRWADLLLVGSLAAVAITLAFSTALAAEDPGEEAVAALLPVDPPPGYGLDFSVTRLGQTKLDADAGGQVAVADFLDERSFSATRVWSDDRAELLVAVLVTEYPYDIFAAAALGTWRDTDGVTTIPPEAFATADVAAHVDEQGQIAAAFRRGDVVAIVVAQGSAAVPTDRVLALVVDMSDLAAIGLPSGDTSWYDFPTAPSKVAGLAMTAGLVTAAVVASAVVAHLQARRTRRRWSNEPGAGTAPQTLARPGTVIALNDDARLLRRRGRVVTVGQLLAVNVGIVAMAGDFGRRGVVVGAIALLVGVGFTRWWQRRELGLLGPHAPPRALVLPRPAGAIVGLVSLAVLGSGIAYSLKGLRYLVLKPTLAQMRWSDLLGLAPRTVGLVFAVGGFVVAVLGGMLFRVARSLSRSDAVRLLDADHRPPSLYLRSFDDDRLPVPVIASARRPLFELFSVRGTDPFEEPIAWELSTHGPVVAVGRPGRSLASLGAARERLSGSTWRDQVAARMREAGVIAIATGETEGLGWELGEVVRGGHLDKTVFVFPPVAPGSLQRRWDFTATSLTRAGVLVEPLPAPAGLVHTAQIRRDGDVRVTTATQRDEATYRTAIDVALSARRWKPIAATPGLATPPAVPLAAPS